MIEGISYLVKHSVLVLAPLNLLQGPYNWKKVMQYQVLSLKSKDLGWKNGK